MRCPPDANTAQLSPPLARGAGGGVHAARRIVPRAPLPQPLPQAEGRIPFRAMRLLVCAVALLALAGCGKKGPPSPPGPAGQITWPRSYPTY